MPVQRIRFNALSGLSCYDMVRKLNAAISKVSMPSRAYTSFLLIIELGYITYITLVSMPSRAYTSFLHARMCPTMETAFAVSMPSRAYTSFLRYPFKNLGFMQFTEPVFAGICQNILTTAVFRAC